MKLVHSKTAAALVAASVLLPATTFAAEGLSYGWVEIDYINLDIDQPGERTFPRDDFDNGGGYKIDVSLPISDMFFIYGNYSDTKADFDYTDNTNARLPGDVDILKFGLGIGAVLPMSDRTDFVVSGGYLDIDFDRFRFGATSDTTINDLRDDPSDGYSIDGLVRSQLTPNIEASAGARYIDIEDIDGFSFIGNVMWEFTQNWGLNVSVDAGSDLVTWAAGVRYSF